jgi:hypothetical protein
MWDGSGDLFAAGVWAGAPRAIFISAAAAIGAGALPAPAGELPLGRDRRQMRWQASIGSNGGESPSPAR